MKFKEGDILTDVKIAGSRFRFCKYASDLFKVARVTVLECRDLKSHIGKTVAWPINNLELVKTKSNYHPLTSIFK